MKKLWSVIIVLTLLFCTACAARDNTIIDYKGIASCFHGKYVKKARQPFSADHNTTTFYYNANDIEFTITEATYDGETIIMTDYYENLLRAHKAQIDACLQLYGFVYEIHNSTPQNIEQDDFLYIQCIKHVNNGPNIRVTAYTTNPEEAVNAMQDVWSLLAEMFPVETPEYFRPTWEIVLAPKEDTSEPMLLYSGALYKIFTL